MSVNSEACCEIDEVKPPLLPQARVSLDFPATDQHATRDPSKRVRHMAYAYECPPVSNTLSTITARLRFRARFTLLQRRGAFHSRHSPSRAIVCPLLTTTPRRRKLNPFRRTDQCRATSVYSTRVSAQSHLLGLRSLRLLHYRQPSNV